MRLLITPILLDAAYRYRQVLLGWDSPEESSHNAVLDAIKSVRLFNYYQQLQVWRRPPDCYGLLLTLPSLRP